LLIGMLEIFAPVTAPFSIFAAVKFEDPKIFVFVILESGIFKSFKLGMLHP